jgi:hypothetical protein
VKLGEHLVAAGVIDRAQLDAGLAHAAANGCRLGAALIALGHANGDQVAAALAKQHGVVAARDRHLAAATGVLATRIPAALARTHHAVIVGEGRDRELVIALQNPLDGNALVQLEEASGRVVVPAAASVARLDEAIARLYPVGGIDIATAAAAAAEAYTPPARAKRTTPALDLGPPRRPSTPTIPPGATATARELAGTTRPLPPALDLDAPPPGLDLAPPSPDATPPTGESIGLAMGSAPEMTPLTPTPTPPPGTPSPSGALKPRTKTSTIPPTRRMQQLAGGTSLRSAPAGRGINPLLKYGLGLAVMAAVAFFTYRECRTEPSWAVKSDYTSTYLRAHLPLPGAGWRGHTSLRLAQGNSDVWTRAEGVYRGGEADDPDEVLMMMRAHAPGQFPDEVDMEAFRRQLDALARHATQSAGLDAATLDCALDSRLRSEPAGRCRGTGTFKGQMINLYLFQWEDSVDDVFVVIYVKKGRLDDEVQPLEAFIREIQVQ